jgi:hypothetical protein
MVFTEARAKIQWANEHLANLKRRISELEDSYSAVIEVHPKFGYKMIKYDLADKSAIEDISLLVGDTLHNLKCALDYGWIKCLERHAPHAINDHTQFPVHSTEQGLKDALTDPKKQLPAKLINLFLAKIKPYPGRNDALWDIKTLNILDKHRLLLPVITYGGITGLQMEDERGKPIQGFVSGTTLELPWYIRVPDGGNVKHK